MPETFTFEEAKPETFSFEEARTAMERPDWPLREGEEEAPKTIAPAPFVPPMPNAFPSPGNRIIQPPVAPILPIGAMPTTQGGPPINLGGQPAQMPIARLPFMGTGETAPLSTALKEPFVPIPEAPSVDEVPVQKWEQKLLYTAPGAKLLSKVVGEDVTIQVLRETYNQVKSLPEFFESPMGVATLAGAKIAPTAVAGLFTGDTLKNLVRHVENTVGDWQNLTPTGKAKAIVQGIGLGTLGALLTHGTARGVAGNLARTQALEKQKGGTLSPTTLGLERLKENLANVVGRPTGLPVKVPAPIIPPALPHTPATVQQQQETKGPEYARSQQKTETVHGDLRTPPVESAEQVPIEEGSARIRSETEGGIPNAPEGQQRVLLTPEQQGTVIKELREEGVTEANAKAILSGKKTPEQVVNEQLKLRTSHGSDDSPYLIIDENADGTRSAAVAPEAGPATMQQRNIGMSMPHDQALSMAIGQGIDRIQTVLERHGLIPKRLTDAEQFAIADAIFQGEKPPKPAEQAALSEALGQTEPQKPIDIGVAKGQTEGVKEPWLQRQSIKGEYDPNWTIPNFNEKAKRFYVTDRKSGDQHFIEPWQMSQGEFELAFPVEKGKGINAFAAWAGSTQKSRAGQYKYRGRWYRITDTSPLRLEHEKIVRNAVTEGKPVPPEVLADYPDLVKPTTPLPGTPPTEATPAKEPSSTTLAEPAAQGAEATVAGAISEATPKAPVAQASFLDIPVDKWTPEYWKRIGPEGRRVVVSNLQGALEKIGSKTKVTDRSPREAVFKAIGEVNEAYGKQAESLPPGPGAASPSEFAQRQASGAARTPPPNAPVAVDASAKPSSDIVRANKDLHLFNRINSGQWNFYFGKLGEAAKAAWERMALGEFRMRESARRDIRDYVESTLKALPRKFRKEGGKALYELMDGKTMEAIRKEWENRPESEIILPQVEKIRTRLEEIRTTIRDVKRDSYLRFLMGMDKDSLVDLFRKNINEQVDSARYTKQQLADGLTLESYPDDWGIADGSYLPHLFFGHWKVAASVPGMEQPQFITRAQTPQEAQARIYELAKKNPEYQNAYFTIEQDTVIPADMIRLGDRRFWKMIGEMKNQAQGAIDPKQAVQGIIGRKAAKQKWFGSLQHRAGFEGYSKNFARVMSSYLNGFQRWKELTAMNKEVQPLIDQVRKEGRLNAAQRLEDLLDNLWGKPTRLTMEFDSLIRRIPVVRDWVKPLALDRWARNATSIVSNLMLRTLRFGVVNRLQPLQGLYPLVGEKTFADAKLLQHTKEGRALLDQAGVTFDPGQYAHEGVSGKVSKAMERFSGERTNQEWAFLAMYLHGQKLGLPPSEAINYAKLRGQLMTQFTPLTVDTPSLFEGPIGKVMFQFKRFPVKQIELTSRMVADRNISGLSRMLAAFAVIGGSSFYLRQAFIDPEKRLKFKRGLDKAYGEKTADAIMYGLPGLAGADLSGSIVLADEPWGSNAYEKFGRQMTGPAVSFGIDLARGAMTQERVPMNASQKTLAIMRRIPSLKPFAELEGLVDGNVDITTPDGETKYRRTIKDALVGLGSFRSANEANLQIAVNGIMELQRQRQELMNARFVAQKARDDAQIKQVMTEIWKFNARWPEAAITSQEIGRYLKYRFRSGTQTDIERATRKRFRQLLPATQR